MKCKNCKQTFKQFSKFNQDHKDAPYCEGCYDIFLVWLGELDRGVRLSEESGYDDYCGYEDPNISKNDPFRY